MPTPPTRITDWGVSRHELRDNMSQCSAEQIDLVERAYEIAKARGIKRAEMCLEAGISPQTFYLLITGKYVNSRIGDAANGVRRAMPTEIQQGLEAFVSKHATSVPSDVFLETTIARDVMFACDRAAESRTPVFLIGPSQFGKTRSLQQWAARNSTRTCYHVVRKVSAVRAFLRHLLLSLDITAPATATTDALADLLYSRYPRGHVLILDEWHLLELLNNERAYIACCEIIRQLSDLCGARPLFSMTEIGWDNIVGLDRRRRALEQLLRRGVHRVTLPNAIPTADVQMVLEAQGLGLPSPRKKLVVGGVDYWPYRILQDLATTAGLTAIFERLRYARSQADKAGEHLQMAHFVLAHAKMELNQSAKSAGWEASE